MRLAYDVGNQEGGSHRQNGVELRESGQNQRLTHHVVTVTHGCDTVGADIALIDGSGEVHDADQNTGTPERRRPEPSRGSKGSPVP